MKKIVELKKFTANFDRLARFATDGKFNSCELAVLNSLEGNEKCIYDIASDIGMSCPTVSTILATHLRKKHVTETSKVGRQTYYTTNTSVEPNNLLGVMFKGFDSQEIEKFMEMVQRVNDNAADVLIDKSSL